jgi:hypothetical protein
MTREIIAYGLIGLVLAVGMPVSLITWQRYRRRKLRRQGIKRHGH